MKYKVGDKVRIKSKEWFDENRQHLRGRVSGVAPGLKNGQCYSFIDPMSEYCGKEATIISTRERGYNIDIDMDGRWAWGDWMFEDEDEKRKK